MPFQWAWAQNDNFCLPKSLTVNYSAISRIFPVISPIPSPSKPHQWSPPLNGTFNAKPGVFGEVLAIKQQNRWSNAALGPLGCCAVENKFAAAAFRTVPCLKRSVLVKTNLNLRRTLANNKFSRLVEAAQPTSILLLILWAIIVAKVNMKQRQS